MTLVPFLRDVEASVYPELKIHVEVVDNLSA
jgi:hypothetical protein